MSDRKGDPTKKPTECKGESQRNCPHMKSVYEGWEYERFECEKCGAGYKLYDEEMR